MHVPNDNSVDAQQQLTFLQRRQQQHLCITTMVISAQQTVNLLRSLALLARILLSNNSNNINHTIEDNSYKKKRTKLRCSFARNLLLPFCLHANSNMYRCCCCADKSVIVTASGWSKAFSTAHGRN